MAKYHQQYPGVEFNIRLHPFQLNGLLTETPVSRREWGEKKFGAERWAAVSASLRDKFRGVGIEPATDSYMSSSHLAHRLTEYAHEVKPASQLGVAMDLFALYHINGTHLSDKAALATLATKHGLFKNPDEARVWLDGPGSDLTVKKAYQRAQRNGITGVPFFVFQDKYAASGAMGVDEFVNIITEITKREKSSSPQPMAVTGDQCIIQNPQLPV